jgi:hypothetical protein
MGLGVEILEEFKNEIAILIFGDGVGWHDNGFCRLDGLEF